jgi:cyanophycinase-like exopeptidase
MIKSLYLLADSQLLFWKDKDSLLTARIREEMEAETPKAAYIGASNGDNPDFFSLFVGAMEMAKITDCRMIPSQPSKEDMAFLEAADLLLLSGGDTEQGWRIFEQNGLKELIPQKRFNGAVLVGISAGAVQLGMGTLAGSSTMKPLEMFRFAPFYVGAHEEAEEWWNLRALVNLSQTDARGIGIPAGGGAIYHPDGSLEPVRKTLVEFAKEGGQFSEKLLLPE